MSRHHRDQGWTTHSRRLRPQVEATLPQPCVDCGRLISRGDRWQVGHRPGNEAMHGAAPTLANVGPSHAKAPGQRACNQIAGGRMGAAVSNAKRKAKRTEYPTSW